MSPVSWPFVWMCRLSLRVFDAWRVRVFLQTRLRSLLRVVSGVLFFLFSHFLFFSFFSFFFLQCPERTCAATSQTNHGRLMLVARERVETRSFAMTADRYGCDFPPSTQTRKIYGILKIHVTVHRSVTENFQQRKTSKFEIPASRIIRNSREFRRRQIFAL